MKKDLASFHKFAVMNVSGRKTSTMFARRQKWIGLSNNPQESTTMFPNAERESGGVRRGPCSGCYVMRFSSSPVLASSLLFLVAWLMSTIHLYSRVLLHERSTLQSNENNINSNRRSLRSEAGSTIGSSMSQWYVPQKKRPLRLSPPPLSLHRRRFEQLYSPSDESRIHASIRSLQNENIPDMSTAILADCPNTGPPNDEHPYPHTWPLLDILQHWNPNDIEIPVGEQTNHNLYQSLCVLDWKRHSPEVIARYQAAEIPFVLKNHPDITRATERWNTPVDIPREDSSDSTESNKTTKSSKEPYFLQLFREHGPQTTKYAPHSNQLSGFSLKRRAANADLNGVQPALEREMTIDNWYAHAQQLDQALAKGQINVTQADHFYYAFTARLREHTFLYDELPIFRPDQGPTLFMKEPEKQRGIRCRFGMTGTVADAHFDTFRNWIVMLHGVRRVILAPPTECPHLDFFPLGHVRGRHSAHPWADMPEELHQAQALQVLLQPGEALYVPTAWSHFLVSLSTTIQCNAPSGSTLFPGSPTHKILKSCGYDIVD